ncbi:MAG: DNA gyrase inhibitor YacG [Porticoccaceae bacterium]|jgi:uncharacterized protein|nr:DNA gyrase inhibitor YacG [Porticoccaceae bacterium]MBT5576991.1 DNA gyrase inhibitor YacG [Porticoccaceae bacterium]MBT7374335.1 DNA gyrase inhibitor YacG [Porticoccaceae bacterium]
MKTTNLQCPSCKANVEWSDKFPHRPFCSQRCQQIDFGDWATESYSIAGEAVLDPELMGQESLDEH